MKWTTEDILYLKLMYARTRTHLIADYLKRTEVAVTAKAKILGLRKEFQQPILFWTPEKDLLLTHIYPECPNKLIALELEISENAVSNRANKLGLKKAPNYCNPSQFTKGHIPANKGQKMTSELRAKVEHTFFKKGHTPVNYRPVGSERVTVDGYVEVKTKDPNIWALKHRIVWEKNHGKIAKGYNVQFKDKNKQNCDISNLYIITRDKQILQNSIMRYAPELRKSIKLISKLNRKIKENE